MPLLRPTRAIMIIATSAVAYSAFAPGAVACVGPGTMVNGRMTGVDLSNCGGGTSSSFNNSGGSVSSEIEGAAAAVQVVGVAIGLLGNIIDSMPKSTFELPRVQLPSVQLPSVQMPSVQLPSIAPSTRSAPPPAQPQDSRAASCARLARIYKASHAKMLKATQHLDDVDNSHPEKLCEFGRDVGVPLLLENVNAVSAARGEACFGAEDQKRLASFRSLLEDERRAFAIDCKRALDSVGAGATTPTAAPTSNSQTASTHQAPTIPSLPRAVASTNDCSTITQTGVDTGGQASCGSSQNVNITGGSSPPPSWSPARVQQARARWDSVQTKYKALPSQASQLNRAIAAINLVAQELSKDDFNDLYLYLGCDVDDYNCLISNLKKTSPDENQPTGVSAKPRPPVVARPQEPNVQAVSQPSCKVDTMAPDPGVSICSIRGDNDYCKKWRQDSAGHWLRNDIYSVDDRNIFSDRQHNIGFATPCD